MRSRACHGLALRSTLLVLHRNKDDVAFTQEAFLVAALLGLILLCLPAVVVQDLRGIFLSIELDPKRTSLHLLRTSESSSS